MVQGESRDQTAIVRSQKVLGLGKLQVSHIVRTGKLVRRHESNAKMNLMHNLSSSKLIWIFMFLKSEFGIILPRKLDISDFKMNSFVIKSSNQNCVDELNLIYCIILLGLNVGEVGGWLDSILMMYSVCLCFKT